MALTGIPKCDGVNGYKCIRGTLFEHSPASGAIENKGACPKCSPGQEGTAPLAIATVANTPAPEIAGVRKVSTNIFGHVRMPTNAKHEALINQVRDLALEFYVLLHDAGGTDPNAERFANRNLAIASTELENAVMHAVKGICYRS